MPTAKKQKNRRDLTTDAIVDAAILIADRDGYEALSMRKLASALGVTAMSVYNHFDDKTAVLHNMLARVVEEFETDITGKTWGTAMRDRAEAMRQSFLRHHWAPTLLISEIALSDAVMADHDRTLQCLINAGFTYGEADWVRNAIDSHVYGYTIQEINYPVEPDVYKAAASQFLPMINADKYPYLHGATREIISGHYDGVTKFAFGLDLLLDGIERWKSGKA